MHAEIFKNTILPLKNILFGIAWRLTQNRMEAEDVVQDVLLKIWDLKEEWGDMESIGAYCIAMTKNRALDKIKSKNFSTQKLDISSLTYFTDGNDLQRQVENLEQVSMVQRIVLSLPEKQQQVIQLREFEDKSYQEISEILNITEDQVKVNLFRARQQVRQELQKKNDYGL